MKRVMYEVPELTFSEIKTLLPMYDIVDSALILVVTVYFGIQAIVDPIVDGILPTFGGAAAFVVFKVLVQRYYLSIEQIDMAKE
ncbi:hypothetical protein ACQKP3_14490 [Vibrio sp. DNB22_10_4]